jgi:hypothetical protein
MTVKPLTLNATKCGESNFEAININTIKGAVNALAW